MITERSVTETGIELKPDPTRVITRFFVAGREDVGPGESRAASVIQRVIELDEADVAAAMNDVDERFSNRHRDLHDLFHKHAALVTSRIDLDGGMSAARHLLLGACFTHEYAIEGAALCNPSAVVHPEQDSSDDVAFIMSVRGIGEGHMSSIGFRTGTLTSRGTVTIDPPGPFPRAATSVTNLRRLARSSYRVDFPASMELSERVLWPQAPGERRGMEDARFVRFVDDSGDVTYYATYTAFNGTRIRQNLAETTDFATFTMSPVAGAAAEGKGLALFPRKVGGRYAALSRSDRQTNAIAFSNDLRRWDTAVTIQVPDRSWEILQLGNCGSPIETEAGWLVITHGVGPMRTYTLGAILLDLDQPQHVIARSEQPILRPDADRRDGYVPNVVYSCGGFAHHDTLLLPYGVGDQTISIATVSIERLLSGLRYDDARVV